MYGRQLVLDLMGKRRVGVKNTKTYTGISQILSNGDLDGGQSIVR